MSIVTAALIVLGILACVYLYLKLGKGLIVLVVLAVPLVGVWMLVHSVQAFNSTVHVATVKAIPVTNLPHTMVVNLTLYNSDGAVKSHATDELSGDLWELDASVVNYYPWVNLLGVSNAFNLNRLTSQYQDYDAHTVKPVSLSDGSPTFSIPFLERSHYQSGVMMPDDGVEYHVFVTTAGSMYAVHA